MVIKLAIAAASMLISTIAYASDKLKQPAVYQPTVETEIARGKSASLRCAGELDWLNYAVCIDRQASREQTPSDAFKLGLNWSATKGLDLRRRTSEPPWLTQDPGGFVRSKTSYTTVWRSLQAKIGLSFEEVESVR